MQTEIKTDEDLEDFLEKPGISGEDFIFTWKKCRLYNFLLNEFSRFSAGRAPRMDWALCGDSEHLQEIEDGDWRRH